VFRCFELACKRAWEFCSHGLTIVRSPCSCINSYIFGNLKICPIQFFEVRTVESRVLSWGDLVFVRSNVNSKCFSLHGGFCWNDPQLHRSTLLRSSRNDLDTGRAQTALIYEMVFLLLIDFWTFWSYRLNFFESVSFPSQLSPDFPIIESPTNWAFQARLQGFASIIFQNQ